MLRWQRSPEEQANLSFIVISHTKSALSFLPRTRSRPSLVPRAHHTGDRPRHWPAPSSLPPSSPQKATYDSLLCRPTATAGSRRPPHRPSHINLLIGIDSKVACCSLTYACAPSSPPSCDSRRDPCLRLPSRPRMAALFCARDVGAGRDPPSVPARCCGRCERPGEQEGYPTALGRWIVWAKDIVANTSFSPPHGTGK